MAIQRFTIGFVTFFTLLSLGCTSMLTSPSREDTSSVSSLPPVDAVTVVSVKKSNGTVVASTVDGKFVVATSPVNVSFEDTLNIEVQFSLSDLNWMNSKGTFYVSTCASVTDDTFIPLWCAIEHPSTRNSTSFPLSLRIASSQYVPQKTFYLKTFVTEDGIGKGGGFPISILGVPVAMIPVKIFSTGTVPLEIVFNTP